MERQKHTHNCFVYQTIHISLVFALIPRSSDSCHCLVVAGSSMNLSGKTQFTNTYAHTTHAHTWIPRALDYFVSFFCLFILRQRSISPVDNSLMLYRFSTSMQSTKAGNMRSTSIRDFCIHNLIRRLDNDYAHYRWILFCCRRRNSVQFSSLPLRSLLHFGNREIHVTAFHLNVQLIEWWNCMRRSIDRVRTWRFFEANDEKLVLIESEHRVNNYRVGIWTSISIRCFTQNVDNSTFFHFFFVVVFHSVSIWLAGKLANGPFAWPIYLTFRSQFAHFFLVLVAFLWQTCFKSNDKNRVRCQANWKRCQWKSST